MNWLILFEALYVVLIVAICLRIIYDTNNHTKTIAYLLLVIFLPVVGIFFYFSFGINYRKRQLYSKKLVNDEETARKLSQAIRDYSLHTYEVNEEQLADSKKISALLLHAIESPLTSGNAVNVLVNGEQKFPELFAALRQATHHIHIEYYIYEDDATGNELADILIAKAQEGVIVRFIYDHFGSHNIHRRLARRLRANGVKAYPFHRITFLALANRLNYRNHRKIVIIDGKVGFVGGINVADKYINKGGENEVFWRDTHLRIEGPGVRHLQYTFLCDWNFTAKKALELDLVYFPNHKIAAPPHNKIVQIATSGPDSARPNILYSMMQAIHQARDEILITTPYYIPGEGIQDALAIAAMGGVRVQLLVPSRSDSYFVNLASQSYFSDLLTAGVEIYQYTKGFVHAKTMVVDRKISVVGTANMDQRSFDLNFEVNAMVYDGPVSDQLASLFAEDIQHADRIDPELWNRKRAYRKIMEKTVRLFSPML